MRDAIGEAIGRNYVEADARKQHDAARFRLPVPRLKRLVDGDLAGDVEIVGAGAQAAFDERLGCVFEGPGAVQHDRDIFQRAVDRGGIIEPEDAALEVSLAIRSSVAAFRPATIVVPSERPAVRRSRWLRRPLAWRH